MQNQQKQSLTIEKDVTNSGTFKPSQASKFYPNVIIKGDVAEKEGTTTFSFRYKSFVSSDLKTPPVALTLSDLVTQTQTCLY